MFNTTYEIRSGSQYGSTVIWLIDEIVTNNKTNKEYVINVIYKNTNSSDENEIRNLKKSLDIWTQYEVILDYDEIGFVSQVTIQN